MGPKGKSKGKKTSLTNNVVTDNTFNTHEIASAILDLQQKSFEIQNVVDMTSDDAVADSVSSTNQKAKSFNELIADMSGFSSSTLDLDQVKPPAKADFPDVDSAEFDPPNIEAYERPAKKSATKESIDETIEKINRQIDQIENNNMRRYNNVTIIRRYLGVEWLKTEYSRTLMDVIKYPLINYNNASYNYETVINKLLKKNVSMNDLEIGINLKTEFTSMLIFGLYIYIIKFITIPGEYVIENGQLVRKMGGEHATMYCIIYPKEQPELRESMRYYGKYRQIMSINPDKNKTLWFWKRVDNYEDFLEIDFTVIQSSCKNVPGPEHSWNVDFSEKA